MPCKTPCVEVDVQSVGCFFFRLEFYTTSVPLFCIYEVVMVVGTYLSLPGHSFRTE